MNSKTASVVVPASKGKVFAYMSDIENLPEWATGFVQQLKVVDGKHKVVTPMGEMFIRIEADEKTGVVDMYAGPTEDQMGVAPTRVVELPGGESVKGGGPKEFLLHTPIISYQGLALST